MIIRWISLVPSKMVKILAVMGRAIGIPVRPPIGPCRWEYRRLSSAVHGFPPRKVTTRTHAGSASPTDGILGVMAMSPEHIDLHRMVDRLDPDQVRALRAVAQQLPRPSTGHQGADEAAWSRRRSHC